MVELTRNLRRALEDWDVVRAEAELRLPEHRGWLEQNSLDLIPLVCGYLTPELEVSGPHLTQCCQELLLIIAQAGSAKENLVGILEQIDGFRPVLLVRRVLPALGVILLKIKEESKSHSWDWGLDTVACHLKTIPYPPNSGLEGEERLTLDLSPASVESIELLDDLVDFLYPLVEATSSQRTEEEGKKISDKEMAERRRVLVKFILQVLEHPVGCLSQHPEQAANRDIIHPRSYRSAERLVGFLSSLYCDIISLTPNLERLLKVDTKEVAVSVGVYMYMVYAESMYIHTIPSVYSHAHVLGVCSTSVQAMLRSEQEMISHKGILLLQSLLQRIPAGSMDQDSSGDPQLLDIIQPLVNLIVYNSVAELRKTGFDSFRMFVNMFSAAARYSLYKYLLKTVNHSGLLGWTVTHLKDTLSSVFRDTCLHPSYSDDRLTRLLSPIFQLKHGAETDLLEISDELIAEINLAYLILHKCPEELVEVSKLRRKMGVWAEQIQEGLKLSKAHWELKQKTDRGEPEVSVSVGGQQLPSMSPEQHASIVRSALTTLDIIQFNLASLLNKLS